MTKHECRLNVIQAKYRLKHEFGHRLNAMCIQIRVLMIKFRFKILKSCFCILGKDGGWQTTSVTVKGPTPDTNKRCEQSLQLMAGIPSERRQINISGSCKSLHPGKSSNWQYTFVQQVIFLQVKKMIIMIYIQVSWDLLPNITTHLKAYSDLISSLTAHPTSKFISSPPFYKMQSLTNFTTSPLHSLQQPPSPLQHLN